MSGTVCLLARTLNAPTAGGHSWVYLNWALGMQAMGCRVVWLEVVPPATSAGALAERVQALKCRLAPFGLDTDMALWSASSDASISDVTATCLDLDAAAEADLFLDMAYAPGEVVARFRRSALLDIDPGLFQLWVSRGQIELPHHDCYFSIGETVGTPRALFPDRGVTWRHTPPCIALEWWPICQAPHDAPFTTVSNWIM